MSLPSPCHWFWFVLTVSIGVFHFEPLRIQFSFQSPNLLDHRPNPLMPCHITTLIQRHIPSMVVLPTTWLDFPILLLLAITFEPWCIDFLFFIYLFLFFQKWSVSLSEGLFLCSGCNTLFRHSFKRPFGLNAHSVEVRLLPCYTTEVWKPGSKDFIVDILTHVKSSICFIIEQTFNPIKY